MAPGRPSSRIATLAACLVCAAGLTGCSSRSSVTFTNVSTSWLNVRFFVGTGMNSQELVSKRVFQVRPSETTRFKVTRRSSRGDVALVHMQVQQVTPSWEGPGRQYWMELLTQEPIKIVASGDGGKLEFETGDGEVARIPKRQLKRRFEYRIAGAPMESP